MAAAQTCFDLLIEVLRQGWSFLQSNEGKIALMLIPTLRAGWHMIRRSRLPEARELEAALVLTFIFGIVIILSEGYPQERVLRAAECKAASVVAPPGAKP